MIPLLCNPNRNLDTISILLSLILFVFVSALQIESMKVHPVAMKRNITIRGSIDSQNLTLMDGKAPKKLRRLPHVFSKVLELPFPSDADVSVEESSDCLRFVVEVDGEVGGGDVRAHAVEIHPGVTKIVIRRGGGGDDVVKLLLDQLKVDAWRFRLPASTRPELATAALVDGELIVTVPKGGEGDLDDGREVWGGVRRLVLVQ